MKEDIVNAVQQIEIKQDCIINQNLTKNELFEQIHLFPHNKKQKDGRVNAGYDKDGRCKAVSISPLFGDFETQIEQEIWPIVKILCDKGYHTISSCAGHPYRALLKIGFGTLECREQFIELMSSCNHPMINFERTDYCINMQMKENFSSKNLSPVRLDFDGSEEYLLNINRDSFNFQFNKNYKRWYILDVIMYENNILNPIKIIKRYFLSKNKKKHFDKIENKIKSDFPFYSDMYRENIRKTHLDSIK
jgi:hypothetical protein